MRLLSNTSRSRACGGSAAASRRAGQAPALSRPSLALLSRTQSSTRLLSHNERLELALGAGAATTDVQAAAADAAANEPAYDVLGLAQAMVDISAAVEDGLLAELGVERGCRRCVGGLCVDGGARGTWAPCVPAPACMLQPRQPVSLATLTAGHPGTTSKQADWCGGAC